MAGLKRTKFNPLNREKSFILLKPLSVFLYMTNWYGRPFVSKLWHDIRAVFCHVYLRSFLLCGFFSQVCDHFLLKGAYLCAQQEPIYVRYKQACVYGVTESRRIRGTELYRHQKTPSCTIALKSNFSKHGRIGRVNFEQGLVLIHCPHASGDCWLPDNGFVRIRGLSLERLRTLFHKCWPKQQSIQLEIRVWQAKHDS